MARKVLIAGKVLVAALVIVLAIGGTLALVASTRADDDRPAREVEVRARDYVFNGTNPPLVLVPGERIRIKFTNDEPAETGVEHNFRIVGLQARCSRPLKPGESEVIEAVVPESGEYRYTCCAHPGMGGKVVLDATAAGPPAAAPAK